MPKTITWPTQPDDFLIIYSYLGAEPPAFGLLYCTCVKRPVLRGSYIVLSMSHGGGMSIPLRQKAAVLEQCHSSVKLSVDTDYGVPLLERGQLLIKNSLCGVNLVDTQFCGGFHSIAKPTIPGHEATGTVAALGPGTSTSDFKVGERVIWVYTGGYAEYSAVPVDNIFKLPRYITDQDALGGLLHGLTALTLVKDAYPVRKGEWVLVHAAQRNIGLLMVQILKAAGAKVIATVHRTAHMSLVKNLGADAVVNISKMKDKEMEWLKTVKDTTKGNGVSVVYDFVGKDTWKKSLEAVKIHGTVVLCGSLSGTVPPIPPHLLSARCIKIVYPTPPAYLAIRKKLESYVNDLFNLIKSGKIKINVHCVYFLEDVAKAHSDLKSGITTGKILLRLETNMVDHEARTPRTIIKFGPIQVSVLEPSSAPP